MKKKRQLITIDEDLVDYVAELAASGSASSTFNRVLREHRDRLIGSCSVCGRPRVDCDDDAKGES